MESIFKKIVEVLNAGELAALCTLVSTKGSTPLKTGAKIYYASLQTSWFGDVFQSATMRRHLRYMKLLF